MTRFLVTAVLAGATLLGQQTARPSDDSRRVSLWVTVTDDKHALVGGLPKEVFEIYEDGKPQAITSFGQGKTPLSIGILLDNSSSMGRKLARRTRGGHVLRGSSDLTADIHRVLSNFLAHFPEPENEFFLIVFGTAPVIVTDFTSDRDTILQTLGTPSPAGQTALFDALQLALQKMETAANSRKVFLLISDGNDNRSTGDKSELIDQLRASDVAIYPVGIFGLVEPRRSGRSPELDGDAWLSRIARQSGGRYFPIVTRDAFLTAADQIGQGLTEQYNLSYHSPPSKLKGRRKIEVKVNLGAYRQQVQDLGAKLPFRVHVRTSYDYVPSGARDGSL